MATITITANGELIDIVITDLPGNDDKTVSLDTPPTFGIDDDIPYIVMKDNDGSTIFGADNTIAQSFTNINGPVTINDVYELMDAIEAVMPSGGGSASTGDAIPVTVAELQALGSGAIHGANYEISNPKGLSFPLVIKYDKETGFTQGYLYITDAQPVVHKCLVEYDLTLDYFYSIHYPKYNLYAQQAPNFGVSVPPALPGSAPPLVNCVDILIEMIAGNQIQNNALNDVYLNNCRIDGFNLAAQPFYEIWMGTRSWLTLGTGDIAFPYYITMFEDSKLDMADGTQLQWCFLYSGCYVSVGVNTMIDYARFYDGVIVEIPANKNFSTAGDAFKEYKKEKSTFTDSIDVAADPTPDLATVAYAGVQTITCTGASITLTELQNLTPNQEYLIYIAAGKTITFDDGAYFIMKGGVDFVGIGNDGDWFLGKTNSDATAMREINRANYAEL